MAPVELRDIFVPTDREQHLLIDLLQRADCCLDDIAQELRTSVAALTIYLASDDAAFTTGAVHVIDGGWVM